MDAKPCILVKILILFCDYSTFSVQESKLTSTQLCSLLLCFPEICKI